MTASKVNCSSTSVTTVTNSTSTVKLKSKMWESPLGVLKSIGPKLVPFLKTLGLYFVIFIPEDRPSVYAMGLKCLPILSLALFVLLHGISLSHEHKFARMVLAGLLFSCMGDALLIWPSYFLHGMAAFGIAQVFYILAFGFDPLNFKLGSFIYSACSTVLFIISPSIFSEPLPIAIGVCVYASLMVTMVWRAIARVQLFEELWTWTKLCSCFGGIAFLVSDTILALNRFYTDIPHHQVLIMVTYYLAQLGIALSVVNSKESSESLINKNNLNTSSNKKGTKAE